MVSFGLVEEVQRLLDLGYDENTCALRTFGYAEILAYIRGQLPLQEAADQIRQRTRQYAKRQLTWFRNRNEICWVDVRFDEPAAAICDRLLIQITALREKRT